MKKFLSAVCLVALCGGVANAIDCPNWKTSKKSSMFYQGVVENWLTLQSNDDIIIKGMKINGGNCAYSYRYLIFDKLGVSDPDNEKEKQEVESHNKWVENAKKDRSSMPVITFKNGKIWNYLDKAQNPVLAMLTIKTSGSIPLIYTFGTSKKKTDSEKKFEELDELSRGAFTTHPDLIGNTFFSGAKASFQIDCNYDDVVEVRLDTDLGECVMPKNR